MGEPDPYTVNGRVLALVRASAAGVRSADVAGKLLIAEDHANTSLSKLARRGLIDRLGRGLYGPRKAAAVARDEAIEHLRQAAAFLATCDSREICDFAEHEEASGAANRDFVCSMLYAAREVACDRGDVDG